MGCMAPGLIDYRDPPPNYLRNLAQPCVHRTPLNFLTFPNGSELVRVASDLASTWPSLAPSWPLMAPFWGQVGPTWPQLGTNLALLGSILALDGSIWGTKLALSWSQVGHFAGQVASYVQFCQHAKNIENQCFFNVF